MFVFLEFAWPAVTAKSSLGPCGFHLWFGKHNMFKRYWWEKESQKNCLDIQNNWLEQAIYFSISMRQFGEDKGQLTSFHNFQKVQVKIPSVFPVSQLWILFFYLKPLASYFSLFICFCSPSIHLKLVSSSNSLILLDVYNVCIVCSLWSYLVVFIFLFETKVSRPSDWSWSWYLA